MSSKPTPEPESSKPTLEPTPEQKALFEWWNHTFMNNEVYVGELAAQASWMKEFTRILTTREIEYYTKMVQKWPGKEMFENPSARLRHENFFYKVAIRLDCTIKQIQDHVFESLGQDRVRLKDRKKEKSQGGQSGESSGAGDDSSGEESGLGDL
ncbi:hypothetical protein K491DRAFT_714511 [Lophiostoma macrostomum CBS 122681]|uniref:Uncharacterized protein n=1 Tax=Lophiostoma macrostomum CBS 122681 TaxID=1314788 RepID=A0A6A6TDC7_9PLEO|nr:hypothetical protein K491DRAFT_714511 [Lophiostoma macrostomum CBS 122681]